MKPDKPYFHELTNPQYNRAKDKNLTQEQILGIYTQSDWCEMKQVLHYMNGCWSLLMRRQYFQGFCKGCEFCKL